MLSIASAAGSSSSFHRLHVVGPSSKLTPRVKEVNSVEDSIKPLQQALGRTGQTSLRLHCTVPMWTSSPSHCFDLHELHDLRHRSIKFLHELLNVFRSNGVQVTYSLAPSNMDMTTISFVSSENSRRQVAVEPELLDGAEAGKTFLVSTEDGPVPVIVMT